jgi:hypothetical protein
MSSSSKPAELQSNTRYVHPITCIIHNLPIKYDDNGNAYSRSLTWMRDMLRQCGYTNVKKVHPGWGKAGFLGYAIIEFESHGKKHESYRQARKLQARYEDHDAGRTNYYTDDGLQAQYLWIATDRDIDLLRTYRHYIDTVPRQWEAEQVPPNNPHIELPIFISIAGELQNDYVN